LFERAAELYRALGDERGAGTAELWIGIFHQWVRDDDAAAVPAFERAVELAGGDPLTLSHALRHLGIAAHRAGRLAEALRRLEESTRPGRNWVSRRGVAANLVGLAYIAAAHGRSAEAVAIAEQAVTIAAADRRPGRGGPDRGAEN
jgi:hypothetical protein